MGEDDLYAGNIRNYYASPFITILSNGSPGLRVCNNDYPDGKAQRREARRRAIRRRKGRL